MKRIFVEISSASALLMHKFPMVPVEALEKKPIEEQAELAAYRDPNGKLCVPSICIQRALVSGATFSKGKGRGSLQKNAAACVVVDPEYLTLGTDTYAVDSRPVVVPATKGRVLRHRPRIDEWKLKFELAFEEDLISLLQIRRIVDDTGQRVGLLDFRPERKGPFGRFIVTSWKLDEEK